MSERETFRHAVMAVAVTFLGGGVPDRVRTVAQGIATRVLQRLDARRVEFDPELQRP